MTSLYLVQHGESLPEEIDPKKNLSDRGREETRRMGRFLRDIGVKPGKIFHSSKLRSIQTAEILAEELGVDEVVQAEGLNPLDDPEIWSRKVEEFEEDIMLVGHLPHLSRLASLLLKSEKEIVQFRYSSVLCLQKIENEWIIKWFVTPELLKD